MILKDGDIYAHKYSGVYFTLRQETPVTWSLRHKDFFNPNDYPIYPEKYIAEMLEKYYNKVDKNE